MAQMDRDLPRDPSARNASHYREATEWMLRLRCRAPGSAPERARGPPG
eukprot:COSAG06_NODE_439_length_15765_cov_69.583812_7_plen_48_part_00